PTAFELVAVLCAATRADLPRTQINTAIAVEKAQILPGIFGVAFPQPLGSALGYRVVGIKLGDIFPSDRGSLAIPCNFEHAGELLMKADFLRPVLKGMTQFVRCVVVAPKPIVGCCKITPDIELLGPLIF